MPPLQANKLEHRLATAHPLFLTPYRNGQQLGGPCFNVICVLSCRKRPASRQYVRHPCARADLSTTFHSCWARPFNAKGLLCIVCMGQPKRQYFARASSFAAMKTNCSARLESELSYMQDYLLVYHRTHGFSYLCQYITEYIWFLE